MERLTSNKPSGNFQALMNYARAENRRVYLAYGEGQESIDLCDYISKISKEQGCEVSSENAMDGYCMACDCPVAILYTVSVQAAELRARLSAIEDILGDEYDLETISEKMSDEPVKGGRWIRVNGEQVCSLCGFVVAKDSEFCFAGANYDYCPSCGKRMN